MNFFEAQMKKRVAAKLAAGRTSDRRNSEQGSRFSLAPGTGGAGLIPPSPKVQPGSTSKAQESPRPSPTPKSLTSPGPAPSAIPAPKDSGPLVVQEIHNLNLKLFKIIIFIHTNFNFQLEIFETFF